MNRAYLILLLAVLLAACGAKTKTSLKVQVSFNTNLDQLRLSGIAVGMGDAGMREPALVPDTPHALSSPTTVIILLPDDWDTKIIDLTVVGLRHSGSNGDEVTEVASVKTSETVHRGVEVFVDVNLAPCDGGCTDADAGVDGGVIDASTPADMVFVPGPSCSGLAATCGPDGGGSCCESPLVTGNRLGDGGTVDDGTFYRSYDGVDGGPYLNASWPATVSDFRLDKYEITVGRFRKFVENYPANLPDAGAGRNPNNPDDHGWNPAWNPQTDAGVMTASKDDLMAAISDNVNCPGYTWIDLTTATNDNLPMNCITWYEAFAFCIWDGGRLPTEAEWNYAAAGGSEQRAYPWSDPNHASTTIGNSCAIYSSTAPQNVGSKPLGHGRFGQEDLAGNVAEWVIDEYVTPYLTPCVDCANFTIDPSRMYRGGGFNGGQGGVRVAYRTTYFSHPEWRLNAIGARCARSP